MKGYRDLSDGFRGLGFRVWVFGFRVLQVSKDTLRGYSGFPWRNFSHGQVLLQIRPVAFLYHTVRGADLRCSVWKFEVTIRTVYDLQGLVLECSELKASETSGLSSVGKLK